MGVRASLERPWNMWRGSGGPDERTRSSVLDIGRGLPREDSKNKKSHIAQTSQELVAKIGLELLTPDFLPPPSKNLEHRNILALLAYALLRLKPKALCLLGRCSTNWATTSPVSEERVLDLDSE